LSQKIKDNGKYFERGVENNEWYISKR